MDTGCMAVFELLATILLGAGISYLAICFSWSVI